MGATTLAVLLAGALPGCNNKDHSVPPGPPGMPAAPEAASADRAAAVHPTAAQMAMPADHAQALHGRTDGDEPPASVVVRGSLNLADNVKAKVPTGGTIFLIARALSPSGGPGPVLAAKKLTVGVWPQPFELSANDVMITGTALSGKIILGARVDQDGDAMTKQAGDVEGISAPVEVPASGVVVLLDKMRTENAGAPSPPNMGGMGGGMMGGSMPPGHPSTELPAGHPSIGAGPDPSAAAAPAMPAGHPPIDSAGAKPAAGRPSAKPAGHP